MSEERARDEQPVSTGNAEVDEALTRLAELDTLPTVEHADVFADVHARLQRALPDPDGD